MVQYTWGWVTATCRRDWTAGPSEIWSPTSKMYGSNYEAPRPLGADLCTLFVGQYPKSFVWKESLVFLFVSMLLAHTVKTIQRSRQTDRRADWLTGWLINWLIDLISRSDFIPINTTFLFSFEGTWGLHQTRKASCCAGGQRADESFAAGKLSTSPSQGTQGTQGDLPFSWDKSH